jgi:hypothetical protein
MFAMRSEAKVFCNDVASTDEFDLLVSLRLLLSNDEFAFAFWTVVEFGFDGLIDLIVGEHQERLEKFRLVSDAKGDKRRFLAAVGGGLVQENVRIFALKQGMFVIQQSGENIEILKPEGEPMVW